METANDTFVTPPSITAKKSSLSSSSGLTPEAAIPVAGRKRRNDDQGDNIMEAHVEEEIKATRQAKRAKRGLSSSPAAFNQLPIVAPAAEKVAVKWDEAVLAASAAAASTLSTKKKKMSGRVLSPMPNKKGGARGASSIKTLVIEDEGITVAKKTALAKAVAVVAAAASEEDSSDDEGFSSAGEEEEEEEFSDDDDEEEGEEERKAGWLTSVLSKLSFRFMG